jgi:hypothetical protein
MAENGISVTTSSVPTPPEVIETFNEDEVTKMINEFEKLGNDVYGSIDSMDSVVADYVQVSSGAIAGKVGASLFNEWAENCVPLLNYKRFFSGISETMRRIYNRSSESAEAIEQIYSVTEPAEITDSGTASVTLNGVTPEVPGSETLVGGSEEESNEVVIQGEVIEAELSVSANPEELQKMGSVDNPIAVDSSNVVVSNSTENNEADGVLEPGIGTEVEIENGVVVESEAEKNIGEDVILTPQAVSGTIVENNDENLEMPITKSVINDTENKNEYVEVYKDDVVIDSNIDEQKEME